MPDLPLSERGQILESMFRERILMFDGAMGTMIQRHKLEEDDFRKGIDSTITTYCSRVTTTC